MVQHPPSRKPPIIIPPLKPSKNTPATLVFIHDYNNVASVFNREPPNARSVAHHIHKSLALQHLKIIIPEALPCIHPTAKKNVWYNLDVPFPSAGNPDQAAEEIEIGTLASGTSARNENDMNVNMDYFESLIKTEIESGTPAKRIVFFGYSQGATMVALLLLTRKLASELGGAISLSGFSATPMESVYRMQRENGLEGPWSKETKLLMLQGRKDVFIPSSVFWYWMARLQGFSDRGQGIASIEGKFVDEMGHLITADLWPHVREFLEEIVPVEQQSLPKL
jgi:predicted esterase